VIYPYAAENRLDAPHAYMYAPYGGEDFLAAYVADRRARLELHLQGASSPPHADLKDALAAAARSMAAAMRPEAFSPTGTIPLQPLHAALLGVLAAGDVVAAQPWLIRVIQRFEVSKKLYAAYAPGFRKGEGDAREPARYAELALCSRWPMRCPGNCSISVRCSNWSICCCRSIQIRCARPARLKG
jgi:hypothetical protein